MPSKAVGALLLLLTSAASFYYLLVHPDGFPVVQALEKIPREGRFPDGTPLRTTYTGVRALDDTLAGLVVFFTLLTDGRDALLATHPAETVVLVSHVTPVKTLLRIALDAGPALLYRLHLDLACLSVVEFWPDGGASVRLALPLVGSEVKA